MNENLRSLTDARTVLERAVRKLQPRELDFRLKPEAKSIAEAILHVGAFEYLLGVAATLKRGAKPDLSLWDQVKPGFAREAGFAGPSGGAPADYLAILAKVRVETASVMKDDDQAITDGDIKRAVEYLRDQTGGDNSAYALLEREMAQSRAVHAGPGSHLSEIVRSHESYHRGQIFLQRHLLSTP